VKRTASQQTFFHQRRKVCQGLLALGLGLVACQEQATGTAAPDTPPTSATLSLEQATGTAVPDAPPTSATLSLEILDLPQPCTRGDVSLEETLARRRSVRQYTDEHLTTDEISQLLWAAQGITRDWGGRTAPSAGALYPLEVYVATPEGLYHYLPDGHRTEVLSLQDLRQALARAGLDQSAIHDAPAVFVIAAVYARTAGKYGNRAERYVKLEAGHVGQNILLQAVALGLGGVPIGAFRDAQVQRVLGLPTDHEPLYLMPVGHPAQGTG
jgi:SagB-type dehydrogenase family enzyme